MDKGLKKVILSAVPLGMGIGTLVLSIMKQLEVKTAITMLSIGLICLSIHQLDNK
ncbi:MAG: hypothetical protein ACOX2A_05070 [Tepidanaerobacteraceae bacterium]|jgi:hypothetical protein|nr:hypothetical protein [Thermoanaerobacterales bacterium]